MRTLLNIFFSAIAIIGLCFLFNENSEGWAMLAEKALSIVALATTAFAYLAINGNPHKREYSEEYFTEK